MEHKIFDRLGMRKPRMSSFDLSREQKLTFKMGELIPTYLDEIVPGDQFRVKTESLIRLSPMLAPVMHRMNVYMHYFYVPNRLLWNQWEDFITGGRLGDSEPDMPIITFGSAAVGEPQIGSLFDYLGIHPRTGEFGYHISQLPFLAYQLIWMDYYRDQNYKPGFDLDLMPQQITPDHAACQLRTRAWEKDYFTSALPFAQRGEAAGINADFTYLASSDVKVTGTGFNADGDLEAAGGKLEASVDGPVRIQNLNDINIDVNDLRTSSAIQRWLEKSARGGSRYIEQILAHFGVKSDDARLQRPEYLGGGKQPIVVSEVLNTSNTEEHPQGDMTGHGISAGTTNSFQKTFKEHGYVMGIMSVLPRTAYYQGIDRHFLRRDKTDFYFPEFANLGEQEIKGIEIFSNTGSTNRNSTFGYQQRYAEYKYGKSSVHGLFRTDLEYWHLARKFSEFPSLNDEFVEIDPSTLTRIFAFEGTELPDAQIIAQLYHDVKARRPMPYFADPRLT